MIKHSIYHEFNLDSMVGNSKPIRITHIDDTNVDVLELCVRQGGNKIDLTGATVIARIVLHAKQDYLINDNVPCTVNDSGNVLIPFDNAVIESHKGVLKIEVNIRRAEDVLTLQFPLWIMVNDTILATAEILPESEGTIPELLKEAAEELERVKDFVTAENVFEILDGTLQGNPNTAPTLLIDNTIDQQFNPDGHWIMFYIDSEDVRHNLFDFANLSSGTSDYQELENKPQINSHTLSGNQSSDDLGLQKKLTAGTNISIGNDGTISASGGTSNYTELENKPSINNVTLQGNKTSMDLGLQPLIGNYFTVENNENISYNFNSVSAGANSVLYCVPFERISNFPNSLVDKISQSGRLYIFHYVHTVVGVRYLIRRIMGYDLNGKYAEFAQYCTVLNDNTLRTQSDWVELTGGGSQIVSGVVNQNGTITFTDSDGNTFTTTGDKIVTSGSENIRTGYDEGGFYFLFENGQGVS